MHCHTISYCHHMHQIQVMNDKAKQTREGVEMNEMNIFKKKSTLYEIVEEIRQG